MSWTPLKEETLQTLLKERREERDARLKALEDYVADHFQRLPSRELENIISFAINDPGSLRGAAALGELFAEMGGDA